MANDDSKERRGDCRRSDERRVGDRRDDDRRRGSRVHCILRLNVVDSRQNSPSEATAFNITRRGAGLILDVPLYSGDSIDISLQGRDKKDITLEGKVVWCKNSGSEYRVGVAFNGPFDLDRLLGA